LYVQDERVEKSAFITGSSISFSGWVPRRLALKSLRRFHGVATKYLGGYLGWRRMLERYRASITLEHCLFEALGRIPQQLANT